jgi:hypothetical protein
MNCSWCRETMDYLHGHGACVNGRCPMFGQNQAPCCDGETAGQCAVVSPENAKLPGR